MCACEHEVVEWHERSQGIHVVGWLCRWCSDARGTDYHHESRCSWSFCGADPVVATEPPFRLSQERFRAELEQMVCRALATHPAHATRSR